MDRNISIFVAVFFLPAFAGQSAPCTLVEGAVCHDTHNSLVLDPSGDLAIAANDTAITRFAYDDDHRVTRAETLIGPAVFDIVWSRDASEGFSI